MKRNTLAHLAFALLPASVVAGCVDLGLEGNVPLDQATHRPASELVAAVHAPSELQGGQMIVDGRLWVPFGEPGAMAGSPLRPVGAADGRTVHARSWDEPPFDALFTRDTAQGAGEQWQGWAPVSGRTGALPGTGAGASEPGDAGH